MKYLKPFLLLGIIVTSLIIGCSDSEPEISKNAKINEISFISNYSKLSNKSNSQDDILSYFLFDGKPADKFITENNVDKESFLLLINEKLDVMEMYKNTGVSTIKKNTQYSAKKKLSCEEIRDAMINECENGYCCGIDNACSSAVKIAYHYRKFRGKC